MKTFSTLDAATAYSNSNPNYGKQFTSPNPGDPPTWCVWETQGEFDAHNVAPPPVQEPRWIPLAEFVSRFGDILPVIEAVILGDATHPPQPALAALKTRLMATAAENPGYINLDARDLRDGLDALIAGWGSRLGFGPDEKATLLT